MIVLALAAAAPAANVSARPKPVIAPPRTVALQPLPTPARSQSSAEAIAAAERAFARRAQTMGQWAAFRATAAPDAVIFVPTIKPVALALAGAPEPSVPVMWWPGTIATSCDGTLGVSTGPWVRAASAGFGTFTTIWRKGPSGYRWQLDQGRTTPRLVAAGTVPATIAPACSTVAAPGSTAREAAYDKLAASVAAAAGAQGASAFATSAAADILIQAENAMPEHSAAALPPARFGAALASGHADDWTLAWASRALLGGEPGAHDLRVWQWRGPAGWKLVMYETIGLRPNG